MFKTNVGGIDRVLRIVAGLVLIGLTLMGTIGPWGWIARSEGYNLSPAPGSLSGPR